MIFRACQQQSSKNSALLAKHYRFGPPGGTKYIVICTCNAYTKPFDNFARRPKHDARKIRSQAIRCRYLLLHRAPGLPRLRGSGEVAENKSAVRGLWLAVSYPTLVQQRAFRSQYIPARFNIASVQEMLAK